MNIQQALKNAIAMGKAMDAIKSASRNMDNVKVAQKESKPKLVAVQMVMALPQPIK